MRIRAASLGAYRQVQLVPVGGLVCLLFPPTHDHEEDERVATAIDGVLVAVAAQGTFKNDGHIAGQSWSTSGRRHHC